MAAKSSAVSPSVERAFAVLELISRNPEGLRMIDVVEHLGVPKTSAYVLLRSLEQLGYLSKDDSSRYRLSYKLFALAARPLANTNIADIARPHLERLAKVTGVTVHLAGLEETDVVYLDKIDSRGLVRFDTYVGKRAPAHLTAVGKAMLAFLPASELVDLSSEFDFTAGTERAIHSVDELRAALDVVRTSGYALEDGEEVEGVRCVSAPVRDNTGGVFGSVGVMGLRSTLTDAKIKAFSTEIVRTADDIAEDLVTTGLLRPSLAPVS